MPNVAVFRPADANETGYCWVEMLKNTEGPSCILTTRQNLPILEGTSAEGVAKGAYVVFGTDVNPELLFLASGSEVGICLEAAKQLAEAGRRVRVVSMPCWELFEKQPTQTLLDMYSILKTQGTLEDLTINMVGDLRYGRTVHSLCEAMWQFNPNLIFTAPEELEMPRKYLDFLDSKGVRYTRCTTLEDHIRDCDILYMTRVQQERFPDKEEYDRVKDCYKLTASMLDGVKPGMKILHPLPRVGEISTDVDSTPYAYYFEQAGNGMYVRMAIISYLLGYR
ncbi:MAG: aspartate carbamoyltransferase [Bacteroidales bacterium]|nr:aspartate carbamoyltransferase [Bacteroidales bacterium]